MNMRKKITISDIENKFLNAIFFLFIKMCDLHARMEEGAAYLCSCLYKKKIFSLTFLSSKTNSIFMFLF